MSAEIRIDLFSGSPLGWKLDRPARAAVEAGVRDYADELFAGLALPDRPAVVFRIVSAMAGHPDEIPYRMWVNGKRCGVAFHPNDGRRPGAESLGRSIQWDLFHNRRLLASEELLLPSPSGRALANVNPARLTVALPALTARAATVLNAAGVTRTIEAFFDDIGIQAPSVCVISERALLPGHVGVRLNDIATPSFPCCGQTTGPGSQPMGQEVWQGPIPLNLTACLKREVASFVTPDAAGRAVGELRISHPEMVSAFERRFDLAFLVEVIQELAEETIPVRNVGMILESMLAVNGTTSADLSELIVFAPNTAALIPVPNKQAAGMPGATEYAGAVRNSMRRILSHAFSDRRFVLGEDSFYKVSDRMTVILLRRELESRIRELDESPFSDAEYERFAAAVLDALREWPAGSGSPIFLTSFFARKAVWRQLRLLVPDAAVLCYQELSPDLDITPVARVGG